MWCIVYRGSQQTTQVAGENGLAGSFLYFADANDAAEHCLYVEKVERWVDAAYGYRDHLHKPYKRANTAVKDTNGRMARLDMSTGRYKTP